MPELAVLGPMRATRDGETVDLGGPIPKKLLATLIAHKGEAVSVTRLLETLWGENPPPSGPATIQSYVSRLRRSLGAGSIETTAAGYRLQVDNGDVDAYRFLSISENLPTEPDARLTAIEDALYLWRGPPFDDFEELEFASRRLMETRMDLEEEKAALLSESGRASEAIGVLEKIISEEPFRESAWIALARTLASKGRAADAIRTFDRYRNKLSDTGLVPSPDLRTAEAELFASWGEEPDQGFRLPDSHTTFHGRESEIKQLLSAIDECRQITLVGPGGMGKTRLAHEAIREMDRRRWLVRLEATRDNSEVAPTVLAELGIDSRGDPVDSIVQTLKQSPGLVVLDNCEHVVDSAARLADSILRETQAMVLATSRRPLSIPGETLLDVGPLDSDSAKDLYVERAGRVNPDFEPDRQLVRTLCSRLDFMPLAIEVAASCARALGPGEIVNRLDSDRELLNVPRRVSDRRHETLSSMVDWSYSLLPRPTQRVFERLSVFNGDLDLEAAERVAGFGNVEPEQVRMHVAELAERSMVQSSGDLASYRMLRVFRSFADLRLIQSSDRVESRNRHKDYYRSLAERIGKRIRSGGEVEAVRRAGMATQDLGEALRWAIETDDFDSAGRILEGLFDWFYHRQPPAIMDWGRAVLSRISSRHEAHPIASAWAATASLKRGNANEALRISESGTASEYATGVAWFITGDVACYMGDLRKSMSYYEEALRRARSVGDDVAVVDALSRLLLSMVRNEGIFDDAMEKSGELVDRLARIEAPSSRAHADFALGSVFSGVDLEKAQSHLRHAVDLARSVQNQYVEGMALSELGSVQGLDGDLVAAQKSLVEAIDVFQRLGAHPHEWVAVRYLAGVLTRHATLEPAATLLSAADASGIDPLANQVSLWSEDFQKLRESNDYQQLAGDVRELDLQQAIASVPFVSRPGP